MFATIIMNQNKELHRTTSPNIYQNENNADKILVLLPESYGDVNLRECSVTLNLIYPTDDKVKGNIKLLEFKDELYKNTYLQCIIPITVTETSINGRIEIFLTIVHPENNVEINTSSTFLEVKPHKSIDELVAEEEISLLSDYLIKMQQIMTTCDQTLLDATEQAEKAKASEITARAETTIASEHADKAETMANIVTGKTDTVVTTVTEFNRKYDKFLSEYDSLVKRDKPIEKTDLSESLKADLDNLALKEHTHSAINITEDAQHRFVSSEQIENLSNARLKTVAIKESDLDQELIDKLNKPGGDIINDNAVSVSRTYSSSTIEDKLLSLDTKISDNIQNIINDVATINDIDVLFA